MKIGLVEAKEKAFSAKPVFTDYFSKKMPSVSLLTMSVPQQENLALGARKLFRNGCDAVFVLYVKNKYDEALREALQRVEIESNAYIYYCAIEDGDLRAQKPFETAVLEVFENKAVLL